MPELVDLTEDTTPDLTDWLYAVDSGGTTDKKVSVTNLLSLAETGTWPLLFERDGSTTGGTQSGGTWTASSGVTSITQGTGAYAYIYWASQELTNSVYVETRVRATAGADRRVGIVLPTTAGAPAGSTPCAMFQYDQSGGTLDIQRHNAASLRTLTSQGYVNTTWYKLGMLWNGSNITVYVDDVLKATGRGVWGEVGYVPGLVAFGATLEIDYLRVYDMAPVNI